MKRLWLASCALAFGCGGQAFAQVYLPPPYLRPPIYGWTGPYAGVQFGAGWGQTNFIDRGPIQSIAPEGVPLGLNSGGGALIGVQGGYNVQFANNWVIGFNGSYSWMNLNGFGVDPYFEGKFGRPITFGTRTDTLGSVTGRVGYAWNNFLIYGSGGFAWAHNSYNFHNLGNLGNTTCLLGCDASGGATHMGSAFGVGFEWRFNNNWSAGVDYSHFDFDAKDIIFTSADMPGAEASLSTRERVDITKVSLNYHFFP
jgi:outer membrane immunogenic protein